MRQWFPLHCHSHFSLLDGLSKPEKIAERLIKCGYAGTALTDHGSIAGCPSILKACKNVCSGCGKHNKDACRCEEYKPAGLKAILGCEFYICKDDPAIRGAENSSLSHLCVLAKDKEGWNNLMKAVSASYSKDYFYVKPRLNLEKLAKFSNGKFITFSGHMGSDLANLCFENPKFAYNVSSYEEARKLVHPDWKSRVLDGIAKYQQLFGKDNFFVEIQLIDHKNLPASLVVARILRHCAQLVGAPKIATADSHYPEREDAADQRILLCSAMDTTMKEVSRKVEAGEDSGLISFFKSNNYHIPSIEEINELHGDNPDELDNTLLIASQCEVYKISGDKILFPKYQSPDGKSPDDALAELCEAGWKDKIENRIPKEQHQKYRERLEREMEVIRGTDGFLASYFLTKADICRYANESLGVKTGKGRGSAAGCFISYLTGITRVDPIRFDLIFERFYNAGRNSPGRIALPDIDTDFPPSVREKVIDWMRDRWGHDKVAQMVTFQRMQGRGALKDVLRAHERCTPEEMNEITKNIPNESEISDQLQEMIEETGEASIILWALQNNSKALKEWCYIREDGELDGPYALDFAQAIRLEGTKRNMSKHASGVIVCSEVLADICPMVYDRGSGEMLVGLDMRDAEDMQLVKIDILSLGTLECIGNAEKIVRTGKI